MNMKNIFVKIFACSSIFFLLTSFAYVFADDIELSNDDIDVAYEIEDDENNTIETNSSDVSSLNLNARSCIVLDRLSKKTLYGKNEYNKVKMASTTNVMVTQTTLFKCLFFFTNFICNTLFFS